MGSDGLLPAAPWLEAAAAQDAFSWWRLPSFLAIDASDATLRGGVVAGLALAVLATLGVLPRLCFALSAPLYLGYVIAARDFLSFQWDNLLVEALVLAVFLPRTGPAPVAHGVFRLLLFKLYLESGIAKAQSHLGDWLDGSAMHVYYETAPLPAWPGWFAHHLPGAWHSLESWGALGLELLGPLLIFGPRPARLLAFAAFTGFQLLNLATANYGFFVYLALALHVFLLDDADLQRAAGWVPHRVRETLGRIRLPALPPTPDAVRRVGGVLGAVLATAWTLASLNTAVAHFAPPGALADDAARTLQAYRVFRIANAYHLFGHITRERIEPELQTLASGDAGDWVAHAFWYKPGPTDRAPPFIAPHQPRVDFRLWFYGLGFQRGAPEYVANLVERVCAAPQAVAELFADPLPEGASAVRIEYWRYRFTTPAERTSSGAWWHRVSLGATAPLACAPLREGG